MGLPDRRALGDDFSGVDDQPRHPSQLYEAGLEGLLLFLTLALFVRFGVLKRPGIATGIFCIGYGVARIVSEFFRERTHSWSSLRTA